MPASGEKLELVSVSVRNDSLQSVLDFASEADPIINSVFPNAFMPVKTIKKMSINTKMTPMEPTFIKMLRSFLLQITASEMNNAIAQ